MAGSINKVTIMGHLGRDPEVRRFQNGGQVVNLRIATSEHWKDKQTGERRERTEWHSVAIFSEPLGRIAEQYLRKGSKVLIEGQLETRKWQDQGGQDRYSTEIVLRPYRSELHLLDRRTDGAARPADGSGQAPRPPQPQRGAPYGGVQHGGYTGGSPYPGGGSYGAPSSGAPPFDDDIPF